MMSTRRTSKEDDDDDNNEKENCAAAAASSATTVATTGRHASSATTVSVQVVALVAAAQHSGLQQGAVATECHCCHLLVLCLFHPLAEFLLHVAPHAVLSRDLPSGFRRILIPSDSRTN